MDYTILEVTDSLGTDRDGNHWPVIHYLNSKGVMQKKDVFDRSLIPMLLPGNVFNLVQNGTYKAKDGTQKPSYDVANVRAGTLPPQSSGNLGQPSGGYSDEDKAMFARRKGVEFSVASYQGQIVATYEILSRATEFAEFELTGNIPIKNIEELKKATK